jgi:arabinose-5-phosphate isomerase
VATKIVATLNSTGTPAIFMHASDAIHGDLGIIQKDDIVLMLSKSGDTPEIKVLIPLIKNFGNKIIGLTANKQSYLAKNADYLLHTPMDKEACPNNLAPTTSTTLQMVMGDALAVALLENKGFNDQDFAKYHPGGTLGKRLYLRVHDLIINNEKPQSLPHDLMKDVIIEITKKRLGATAIVENDRLIGIITDGDVRRMLQQNINLAEVQAQDVMSETPKTIIENALAVDALKEMQSHNISQLVVTDEKGNYKGMIHLHDLLKEGII